MHQSYLRFAVSSDCWSEFCEFLPCSVDKGNATESHHMWKVSSLLRILKSYFDLPSTKSNNCSADFWEILPAPWMTKEGGWVLQNRTHCLPKIDFGEEKCGWKIRMRMMVRPLRSVGKLAGSWAAKSLGDDVCVCVCMQIWLHMYVYVYVCTYIHTLGYIHGQIGRFVSGKITGWWCVCVCVYVYLITYIYIYVYVCTYIYTLGCIYGWRCVNSAITVDDIYVKV